MEDVTNDLME